MRLNPSVPLRQHSLSYCSVDETTQISGYNYLTLAKTFVLMGQAFAAANLKLLESRTHHFYNEAIL